MILCGCLSFLPPFLSIAGHEDDFVKKAQEALTEHGMDPGPIDGIMGPRTESAIKKYQMENDLRKTGKLDSDTQKALGIVGDDQSVEPKKPDLENPQQVAETERPDFAHPQQRMEEMELPEVEPIAPPSEGFQSKDSVKVVTGSGESVDRGLSYGFSLEMESSSEVSSKDITGYEGQLRLSTIASLVALSGMGLAALQPVGWILLTGASLILSVWVTNWIGGYFNLIAYGVFAGAYILPVLFRLLVKSWDMAVIFGLLLGTPVLLISKYAFGLSWWMAGCNGLGVMTLLPTACRRLFAKRRPRRPYETFYYKQDG